MVQNSISEESMIHVDLAETKPRKKADISLADKFEAVKLLEQKVPLLEIAKRFGCSQAQVSSVILLINTLSICLVQWVLM